MTVVDASVAIKWFVEERGSNSAREMLATNEPLSAPGHFIGEVSRGLLRSKRAGFLSLQDATRALVGLPAMVALEPMDSLASTAFEIADATSVTIYDAFYVALAEVSDDVLVTSDERLCNGLASSRWAGRAQHLRERAVLRGLNPDR